MASSFPSIALFPWTWLVGALVAGIVYRHFIAPRPNLDHIPAMGFTNTLLSYLSFVKYFRDSRSVIEAGYEKHHGTPFRVPLLDKWVVVLCGQKYIEDIRRASSNDLSITMAVGDAVQMDYTMHPDVYQNPYQIEVVRSSLYNKFPERIPEVQDEVTTALHEMIPSERARDWMPTDIVRLMQRLVCRSVNRIYVGPTICRDPEYLQLNIDYTINVVMSAIALSIFPTFLKPILAYLISPVKSSTRRVLRCLGDLLEARLQTEEAEGPDWPGRPNDLISWLLEHAKEHQRTVESLAQRVLFVNFASIHTTSNVSVLSQAIYRLAMSPEYLEPLRQEIEQVVERDGWSHAGLGRMRKLDSFLREVMRIEGPGQFLMSRIVANSNGFRFHDGTFLPQGSFLSCGAYSVHHDPANYTNPDDFDGFRFANSTEANGDRNYRLTHSSRDFLAFGNGVHACPGRYFAAAQMKVILGHVILGYDISYQGEPPKTKWYGENCIADPSTKILLRER